MSKRKLDEILVPNDYDNKKTHHSMDSSDEDEEEKKEKDNVLHENDLEGVEDGPSAAETNVGFTAFNMKEEMEEGKFDADGFYHWKKEKEIRDNWLDNIDWVKVQAKTKDGGNKPSKDEDSDSDSDGGKDFMFNPIELYKKIIIYLQPGESVSKALCRLGKGKKKLSTAERWKKKKDPNAVEDENSINITKLTEIANELLTRTGNMDIYQETYEEIQKKIQASDTRFDADNDMFSDNFESKEETKVENVDESKESLESKEEKKSDSGEISWEIKWSQEESAKIHGPHTSEQMNAWSKAGYFKNGAWVRKIGSNQEFYSASRIDFELYI